MFKLSLRQVVRVLGVVVVLLSPLVASVGVFGDGNCPPYTQAYNCPCQLSPPGGYVTCGTSQKGVCNPAQENDASTDAFCTEPSANKTYAKVSIFQNVCYTSYNCQYFPGPKTCQKNANSPSYTKTNVYFSQNCPTPP